MRKNNVKEAQRAIERVVMDVLQLGLSHHRIRGSFWSSTHHSFFQRIQKLVVALHKVGPLLWSIIISINTIVDLIYFVGLESWSEKRIHFSCFVSAIEIIQLVTVCFSISFKKLNHFYLADQTGCYLLSTRCNRIKPRKRNLCSNT